MSRNRNTVKIQKMSALCEYIWLFATKSRFDPSIKVFSFLSAIIQATPVTYLLLLPFVAIIISSSECISSNYGSWYRFSLYYLKRRFFPFEEKMYIFVLIFWLADKQHVTLNSDIAVNELSWLNEIRIELFFSFRSIFFEIWISCHTTWVIS